MDNTMTVTRFGKISCYFLLWTLTGIVLSTTSFCPEKPNPKICDYLIVGAGAAGATIASRLSEDPSVTVCLFEAGIPDTSPDVAPLIDTPRLFSGLVPGPITYNYTSEPQKGLNGRTLEVGTGKTLGGSTTHNTMAVVRGFKADYDHWAANGAQGWSFKDVLPFFLKMENILIPDLKESALHNTCGPLTVSQDPNIKASAVYKLFANAAKETGLPVTECNEPSPFGVCAIQYAVRNGVRESTSTAYLRPVSGRRNLMIFTESLVEKILISLHNKKAYGIRYSKDGKIYEVKARREVIVSGGSYGSAQLLQLSGVGPAQMLRKLKIKPVVDLPVGYNLQDHNLLPFKLLYNVPVFMFDQLKNPKVLADYIFSRSGRHAFPHESGTLMFLDTNKQTSWPESLILTTQSGSLPKGDDPRNSTTGVMFSLHPKSRGTVKVKSKNPRESPAIDARYLQEESDVTDIIDAVRNFQRIIATSPSMRAVKASFVPSNISESCSRFKSDSDQLWECVIRSTVSHGFHPVSTCRMGLVGDRRSVVDYKLRVHGIKGLRVADASIMPEITSGLIMAPTIMIGEKAAEMIKQDYISTQDSYV